MKIVAAKSLMKANDQIAAENRMRFNEAGVYVVNLVGSPGCGKTTLLEAVFANASGPIMPAVIEGDLAGQVDAERMQRIDVPCIQINTEGMCHLDASMIASAVEGEPLEDWSTLYIENVGNLVCTAGYDLGEHLRVVVLSVPEGDDKLVKYPTIFSRSDALVVTKTDLLGHCPFDLDRVRQEMKQLAPDAEFFAVSARTGDGIADLADWIHACCPEGTSHCERSADEATP